MTAARIARVERRPLAGLSVPRPDAPRALVAVEVDWGDGRTFGEASPLEGFSRESDAEVSSWLAVDRAWEPALPPAGPPSAVFALEAAALDRRARSLGVSAAEALAGGPVGAVALASLAPSSGGRVTKIKLPRGRIDHAALAPQVRAARRVRFDANGAWSLEEAPARLAELARYEPELVEQPCPRGSLAALRAEVPWAADESLADECEVSALLANDRCVCFVLKPSLLGLARSLSLAHRAAAAGKRVVVTHAFAGPVDLAASRAVAHALAGRVELLACGLGAHENLSRSPLACALEAPVDDLLLPPRATGLGVLGWR